MEITPDFMSAIDRAIRSLRNKADILEQQKECQLDNKIGQFLRIEIEESRQTADLLNGWLIRARIMQTKQQLAVPSQG